MSISNFGGDFSHFWGAALLSALGVSRSDFSQLWIGVLIRVLCCAIPAVAALWLVPEGGPADAVDEFQQTMGLRAQAGGLEEGMAGGGGGGGGPEERFDSGRAADGGRRRGTTSSVAAMVVDGVGGDDAKE